MEHQTEGIVISVKKQWWLKVNTKAFRKGPLDGATFPHIIKVKYVIDGRDYTIKSWISAGEPVPAEGSIVRVFYNEDKPSKGKVR